MEGIKVGNTESESKKQKNQSNVIPCLIRGKRYVNSQKYPEVRVNCVKQNSELIPEQKTSE
jgi:hypothetical protein